MFVFSKKSNRNITNDYSPCKNSIWATLYRVTVNQPNEYKNSNYADKSSAGQYTILSRHTILQIIGNESWPATPYTSTPEKPTKSSNTGFLCPFAEANLIDPALIRYRSVVFEHIGGIRQGLFSRNILWKKELTSNCLAKRFICQRFMSPKFVAKRLYLRGPCNSGSGASELRSSSGPQAVLEFF